MQPVTGMRQFLSTILLVLAIHPECGVNGENLQAWSHRVYLDEPYNISCREDGINLTSTSKLLWTRHGSDVTIMNDDQYELYPSEDGVEDAVLQIKNVSSALSGFYLCHIEDTVTSHRQVVLQGINIGPYHRYHDQLDRYRTDIFRGVIASACVAFIVIGIGLLSTYRYLTDIQKAKRRHRKSLHRAQKQIVDTFNGVYENEGMRQETKFT